MKAGPRLQNITMSPKGQGLLKQNLQGHKYKKKKKKQGHVPFLSPML
jgi:hypothetical protein